MYWTLPCTRVHPQCKLKFCPFRGWFIRTFLGGPQWSCQKIALFCCSRVMSENPLSLSLCLLDGPLTDFIRYQMLDSSQTQRQVYDIRFISNLGPTSASCTCFGPLFTKTWCLPNARLRGHIFNHCRATYLKEIKSSSLEKVMTLLLSSFGTGKRYFKQSRIRSPSLELKFSKMRCGYCSETVEDLYESMSCRRLTL